ncbi:hypothetical protein [Paraburkholderia sp. RAU2J]|uniref:hypothetical protein n=1 Tax=Paraburkholderia sp. RAU2J TaxID=1938810 RepID=UPI0013158367|nr:hypothetical protein [Paraburkholderia sp. RAU2J]
MKKWPRGAGDCVRVAEVDRSSLQRGAIGDNFGFGLFERDNDVVVKLRLTPWIFDKSA